MDAASVHVVTALESIGRVQSQLQSFGYRLYLQTKAVSWTQPTSLHFFYDRGHPYRALGFCFGFCILRDSSRDRGIGFEFEVSWDTQGWSVQSNVSDEDETREGVPSELLWQSAKYQATTLAELLESLQKAVDAQVASLNDARVASYLACIEPR